MALPKMKQPIFELILPSNKRSIRFRPFTVAEEKLLMFARESDDVKDVINVYKQLINNCILDTIDVDKMSYFDLEYFFLMLRAKSVSNIVELQVKDEDGHTYNIQANLEEVQISQAKMDKLIDLGSGFKVMMKYPSYETISMLQNMSTDETLALIRDCIEQIYEGETVYETSEYSTIEMDEFVLSLGTKEMMKIKEFFEDMPKVYMDLTYKTKAGEDKQVKIEGIQSFFE